MTDTNGSPVPVVRKSRFADSAVWGTIACGAGLFSDGYLNAIIGPVGVILKRLYKEEMKTSKAQQNVYSIAFAGTIVGQLFFGWTSDHISRKWSLMVSTIILIVFAIMCAASSGAGGSIQGMLAALAAYRFFLGIGIGGEYPAGSVGAAEHSGSLKSGTRNRWFIMFTNVQIDLGFVVAPLTAMIVILACTENHLRAAWRIMLAIGAIPPISLLFLRMKISEPEPFKKERMSVKNTPWLLAFRFYGLRLATVSIIWFIYDFSAYAFFLWFGPIIENLNKKNGQSEALWINMGWNTLLSFFYMPGAIAGSFLADTRLGPKWVLCIGLILQAIVGFVIAGRYEYFAQPDRVAGFVVIYGIFLALGEVSAGDNIGLFAAKTSSTHIRGKYYGVAAAIGKLGAFVGNWVFPEIAKLAPKPELEGTYQFYVGGALSFVAALLALTLPKLHQDIVADEDLRFRAFLEQHGYDTSVLGIPGAHLNNGEAIHEEPKHEIKSTYD